MIYGIAWDDEPGGYVAQLSRYLNKFGVTLRICADPGEFVRECRRQQYDFAVVDLIDAEGVAAMTGADLLRTILSSNPSLPGFVVTASMDAWILDKRRVGLPASVIVK